MKPISMLLDRLLATFGAAPPRALARRLRHDQFVHFARPRRLCIRAERGTLWVTIDRKPEDIELNAGESRVFDGTARVVVGAIGGDAAFTATPLPVPRADNRRSALASRLLRRLSESPLGHA